MVRTLIAYQAIVRHFGLNPFEIRAWLVRKREIYQ